MTKQAQVTQHLLRGRRAVIVCLYFCIIAALAWLQPTLGHDEAQYAMGGKWAVGSGLPSDYPSYRPVGMRALGALPVLLGGSDAAFRGVSILLFGGFLAAFAWMAGRIFTSRLVPMVATAALASMPGVLWRSYQFLSDLPSATLMFLGIGLLLGPTPSTSTRRLGVLVAAALAMAGAIYLRYGQLPFVGLVVLSALVFSRPVLRWGLTNIAVAALVGGAALAPLAFYSVHLTDTPWGIFTQAQDAASKTAFAQGLRDYGYQWFGPLAGPVGVLGAVGIWFSLAAALRRTSCITPGRRIHAAIGLAAVAAIIVLGSLNHGEPRYIFAPMALLVAVGTDGILLRARASQRTPRALSVLGYGIGLTFVIGVGYAAAMAVGGERSLQVVRQVANSIARDNGDAPCQLLTTDGLPLAWYSRCEAFALPALIDAPHVANAPAVYVVGFTSGRRRREVVFAAETSCSPWVVTAAYGAKIGDISVCKLEPPSSGPAAVVPR